MVTCAVRYLTFLCLCAAFASQVCAADRVEQALSKMRYEWRDEELPPEALTLWSSEPPPKVVTSEQAAEDVGRLFYLLSHGYSGHGFFAEGDNWRKARERLLRELETRPTWRVETLPAMFRAHLQFIRDCHVRIEDLKFGDHHDFWYDTTLEVRRVDDGYRCDWQGEAWSLGRINGGDPAEFLFPSLNRHGEAIHRIGLLSPSAPGPVAVELLAASGSRSLRVALDRSDFKSYTTKIFRRDTVGGMPVIRVRSFSDFATERMEQWLETADESRGRACVIVDVRGHGGGNERYASEWIRRLTGVRPGSIFIFSELFSRTTMAGRANAFALWKSRSPDNEFLAREAGRYADWVNRLGPGGDPPFWSEPRFPNNPTIPNETTIVIITNGLVASAGEGFVMRARQAENVIVVGENTMGALTFGNVSYHQLPNSRLDVWLPINFGIFPDLLNREEVGLRPDYWVPAVDAVDYAVAAIRSGTIATARPLPQEWLQQDFRPEASRSLRRRILIASASALVGGFLAFLMRRLRGRLARPGAVGIAVGAAWALVGSMRGKALLVDGGVGLLALGIVLVLSGLLLWKRCQKGATDHNLTTPTRAS